MAKKKDMNLRIYFKNGYGASIIDNEFSYGLELAVLDKEGKLTTETPITDDVLGFLSAEDLVDALIKIQNL